MYTVDDKAFESREAELPTPTTAIEYRLADSSDVEFTYEVFLEANEELNSRLHPSIDVEDNSPAYRALAVRHSALRHDAGRFWIAETHGHIVGFGIATLRGSLWYLAALHVLPGYQSQGIGRELLQRCLTTEAPGGIRLTVTEAGQPVSNALYGRFGMFPQTPLVHVEGPVWTGAAASEALTLSIIEPADCAAADLAAIDKSVFGTSRPEDHECWLGMPTMAGYRLHDNGEMVGYLYLDGAGVIGPVATSEQRHLVPAIEGAVRAAADEGIETVRARVPGPARPALDYLLRHGFRFGPSINLLLTSRDICTLDRYLFSGGDALY